MISIGERPIVILYGGWSHEAALSAYPSIEKAVKALSLEAIVIDVRAPDFLQRLTGIGGAIVFPASHGAFHEDGKLQGLFEILDIPYVGSGVAASAVGMNKLISKHFFSGCGYKTAPYEHVSKVKSVPSYEDVASKLSGTLVLKPVFAGASFGVCRVENKDEYTRELPPLLDEFNDVLIEKYIDGRGSEFSISVLSTSNGPLVLPVCEIKTGSGIFDYKVKFTPRLIDERMPAEISPVLNSKLQNLGAGIFQKLGCAGFARIDVIVDKFEDPYVLEVNTLPGLLPTSIFPKACMAAGISYNDMIRMLLENALDAKPMEIKKQIELKELPDDIKQAMA